MSLPDTRAARAAIFDALRPPPRPLAAPDLRPFLEGRFGLGDGADAATLVARFEAAARGWRADVLTTDEAGWPQVVRRALQQRGCRRVVTGVQPAIEAALEGFERHRFAQPLEAWKHELFADIDAAVTSAAAGAADTGTLLLLPGAAEPRSLSLVPPVHVALLRTSRLFASLPAALAALDLRDPLPTNLLFVSGPSKTADIQQVLAFGAHGPKALVIVLVDDTTARP